MTARVEVSSELLAWARQRSGLTFDDLSHRFPKLSAWEHGDQLPTLKQLENYARATHTAIGLFFLPEPPEERVPIPDFRTIGNGSIQHPSANLLDTIYQCEQRQDWYRDYATVNQEEPVGFVGSLTALTSPVHAAALIREALDFEPADRGSNWAEALRILIDRAEGLGILVMVNGVVGSNTHRKLDPREFRGFALADQIAPVIFINGADTKAAQIFTLVHELAHLWLGETALDNLDLSATSEEATERWCNQVASEILVPLSAIVDETAQDSVTVQIDLLARRFKVSTLVALRRLYDARRMNWADYRAAYEAELGRVLALLGERSGDGGNFFNTQPLRVSRRFTSAVVTSTLEGQMLYRDAFQMLGFKKVSTFNELASRLGIL